MTQGSPQGSAAIMVLFDLMPLLCIGSNFSATLVRPTLRKRLEASPVRVLLIEFITSSFTENAQLTDFLNSLNPGIICRHPALLPHLKQGCRESCCGAGD